MVLCPLSVFTFWKMKSEGKVLEMSSLMRSRLDSLSARDAPPSNGRNTHRYFLNLQNEVFSPPRWNWSCEGQREEGRRTALAVVHWAGLAVTPPLLFGSGEEDLIELCSNTNTINQKIRFSRLNQLVLKVRVRFSFFMQIHHFESLWASVTVLWAEIFLPCK